MVQSSAKDVKTYLAGLPDDRRKAIEAVRETIRANLDPAFEEGMQYGMIGYYLPHSVYPAGYHCDPKQPLPFAGLASQKNHMAIYLFCIYTGPGEEERFREAWKKTGKKLDMGKSCVRFKKLEDVALDVLGAAIRRATAKRFVQSYEAAREEWGSAKREPARKKTARKAAKKAPARKTAAKGAARSTAKKATKNKAARTASRKAAGRK